MTKRRLAWLSLVAFAIVAMVVAVTASAGGKKSDGVTINVWSHQGQPGEQAVIQDAVKAFNASQSDVVVNLKLIPDADYTKTVDATPPSGLPDALDYDGPTMSAYIYAKKLRPLEGLVSAATLNNESATVRTQDTYLDGKLYGVALTDSGLAMYGNKALLTAAGVSIPTTPAKAWTANQFTAVLKKLAAKDKDGKVLDIKENYTGEWWTYGFLPIVASTGNYVVHNDKASGYLNSPKVVAALTKFASWRRYVDPNADDNAFVKGRVALSWVGHWEYPRYSKALGSKLVLIPLPDFGAGTKTGQGSWAWGISATSQQPAAAGKWLDFLMSDQWVSAYTHANGAPPGTRSAYKTSPLYKPGGPLSLFAQQLRLACGNKQPTRACVATPRPVTPAYPVITQAFANAFQSIYHGGNAKALLDKAAKIIDTAYSDNNNYGH
jgi:ABC-type glycerol-3-phosphate transport system substrate-binding protein